jgi:hypothetical protein
VEVAGVGVAANFANEHESRVILVIE